MDAEAFKHLGDSELGDSQRVVHSQNEITSCCSAPHTHSHPQNLWVKNTLKYVHLRYTPTVIHSHKILKNIKYRFEKHKAF